MNLPILIFDYDGTIHQTDVIYESAVRKVTDWLNEEYGQSIEQPSHSHITGWLGMKTAEMWQDFAPQLSEEIRMLAGQRVGEMMQSGIKAGKAIWYTDAKNVLDELKDAGYQMHILSNCDKNYADLNWDIFSMYQWFDSFIACETFNHLSKAEVLKQVIRQGIIDSGNDCVMIGDRKNDIEAGVQNGMFTIGCLYGYGQLDEMNRADAVVSEIRQIPEIIRKIRM